MNLHLQGKRISVLLLMLSLVISGVQFETAYGQELVQQYRPASPPFPVIPKAPSRPEGAIDCFDFYTFGSVKVDVISEPQETFTGLPIQFRGELRNENPYPVVDAQVYIKVFHKNETSSDFVQQNGYPLVDFVLVEDSVSIPGKGSTPITFTWTAPQYAEVGEYEVAFFVTSAKRSNLLGLTFTDDVTGNKLPITLKALSNVGAPVHFDKNAVTLNKTPYRFAAFPPHFGKDESVSVGSMVVNPSTEAVSVNVVWITSVWDGLRETSVLDRRVVTVTLAPGETKEVTYTPPVLQSAVTFVSSELSYKDTTSLLHVRYVRDGVDEVRMNFPGVSTYPLKKGEPVDIFSCVHSTNIPLVKDGVLTLTLLDEKGDTLHSYTYSGNITSPMMGVKEAFTPASDTENFTLTATLKLAGKTIDSMSLSYSCKDIDPSLCPTAQVPVENTEEGGVPFWYVLVPLTILMLIGGLVFYRSNKKKLEGNVQQP